MWIDWGRERYEAQRGPYHDNSEVQLVPDELLPWMPSPDEADDEGDEDLSTVW